ncbi:MAG: XRE family transcriptional regulator [Treponema sp.]|jgi:putative transcriptional regulator|nr:XRE family transcriptional regulator [Treponema sp.]
MRYKSEIFEVIHQSATDKFEIGAISTAQMREFDEMCLVQEPEAVKEAAETVRIEHIGPVPVGK